MVDSKSLEMVDNKSLEWSPEVLLGKLSFSSLNR